MAGKIVIKGARVHNLKSIDLELPRDRLVVVTGVSGSGKSSLVFDTLYAEGQRRYVESLSAGARQFLEQLEKPDVDRIEGLLPAIAIRQNGAVFAPRSTVGTLTEAYDYLRLLFARVGQPTCIQCGRDIAARTVAGIVDELRALPEGARLVLMAPIGRAGREPTGEVLRELAREGFARVKLDGRMTELSEALDAGEARARRIDLVVDRLVVREGVEARLADSIETAARYGEQTVKIEIAPRASEPARELTFSLKPACAVCGLPAPELTPQLFSFNSPQGACPACGGLGFGNAADRATQAGSDPAGDPCPACQGARLRPESLAVKLGGRNIAEVAARPILETLGFLEGLRFTPDRQTIAANILPDLLRRLRFLVQAGLDYLTLDRPATTLSGGEAQRVRLATQIGSGLAGVLYVLDEPTIGLHQRDNRKLLAILKQLRDLGNSVIVVEHDEETIREADHLVELGPGPGVSGGWVVAQGTLEALQRNPRSITGRYLSGAARVPVPAQRRSGTGEFLVIRGARHNNLAGVCVKIPVGALTCVTGVSGSGKSSLVIDVLYRAMAERLHRGRSRPGSFDAIEGWERFDRVTVVDQLPIGRSPRSNPATYTGIHDAVRDLFAQLPESRVRGYGAGRFSFNASGGRCEVCQGDGVTRVDMSFLPDVFVTCTACGGRRYNRETLQVRYKGLSIADVLDLTVSQAADLLGHIPAAAGKLRMLVEVGLGYLRLGQPAHTLSGGEAQRVKLSRELGRRSTGRTLYILDEPTSGLHLADIEKLCEVLQRLTEMGNTLVVIEHNLDMIKTADYIIDMGPEGGNKGGEVVATGTPEEVSRDPRSFTGRYLAAKLV